MVPEKPWHGDRLSGREVRRGYPAVDVGHVAHVGQHHAWNGGPSVPDQTLLDAQVPGGPDPALNDQGCQCVVSWRLGVSNVMTCRDAGWVGLSNERGAVCPAGRGYFGCSQSPWWRLALSGRNARRLGCYWGRVGGTPGMWGRTCNESVGHAAARTPSPGESLSVVAIPGCPWLVVLWLQWRASRIGLSSVFRLGWH